ncbi:MAG: hypothetical protein NTY81_00835 [Candidatus Staskawiczbacteria bacterium]|nr:hypothetical protein [Candidatus Staskawiczbacteria bacterium]
MEETQTKMLLPVVELFKKSFDAYYKKIWTYAGIILFGFIGALVLLPAGLIGFLISYWPFQRRDFNITIILVDVLLGLVGILICIIFSLWSKTALYCAVKDTALKFKASLEVGWQKIASFFWISLLVGLATLGGLILLIIPGIIFAIWFCFSMFVYIDEGAKGTSALKRSKQLVQGYWWPIFGRLVVIFVVAILLSWIKFFGTIINIFFVAPFTIVFLYALYQDLKRVKS